MKIRQAMPLFLTHLATFSLVILIVSIVFFGAIQEHMLISIEMLIFSLLASPFLLFLFYRTVFYCMIIEKNHVRLYFSLFDLGRKIPREQIISFRKTEGDILRHPFHGAYTYEIHTTCGDFHVHIDEPERVIALLGLPEEGSL